MKNWDAKLQGLFLEDGSQLLYGAVLLLWGCFNFNAEGERMDYNSISEIAKKWGVSIQRVQLLCKQGRIDGAKMIGKVWIIPADAEKPSDRRIKTGKYVKSPN